ncbi:MAG: aspartate kinase [Myxococcota bacterium]|nr:aspartate kinase [Myxococcota bacterium]
MAIVVQKYGGSSVATPELLSRVADRIVASRQSGDLPVVVVSAMGKTTDELLALASAVSPRSHRREMDMILTAGERISMALLAMAVRDRGCQAISLTGSQAGIITTTNHNQARIIEVRPVRVHEALEEGKVVIVGGFAGVSTDKEVTTLGRGGSDTTAIALAAALDAGSCDIFSDVEGVYTADPRIVEDAQLIDRMSHGEILELGLHGARVLAPEAVDYARRHGIALHARSSFSAGRGTLITSAPEPGLGRAVGITADHEVLPTGFVGSADDVDRLLLRLDALGLTWKDLRVTEDGERQSCEFLFDTRNTPDCAGLLQSLADEFSSTGATLVPRPDMATVTVVGEGIAEGRACWEIARSSLATLGVPPRSLVGSSWGITAEVPRNELDSVLRNWHDAFPGLSG